MLVDVSRPERLLRLEHRAEDAVRPRQRAERSDEVVAHPRREEAPEAARLVGQSKRGVARGRQLARAVDEPLEDVLDRQLGRDGEHCVAHRLQRRAEAGSLAHAPTIRLVRVGVGGFEPP